eukprot:jgi/Hompol1/7073/HPOL_005179-RA
MDPVAARSKIYGIATPPRQSKRITSESYAAPAKKRPGSHSASFLPQVPHHNQSHTGHLVSHSDTHPHRSDQEANQGEHHTENGADGVAPTAGDDARPNSAHSGYGAATAAEAAMIASGAGAFNHFTKALHTAMQQSQAASAQSERLRILLREKEMEGMRLKHENVLLKQIERRQQKDIEQFESQAADAPRVIRGLREELSHIKHKVKVYFAQIGEDSRQIRQIDEERRRLREHNNRLEKLVAAKSLADRDTLNSQLEEANQKLTELDKLNSDLVKKAEFTEKNLMSDNRQLRGKIHSLERENQLIHDRIQKLEDTIHEKEKTIASLAIYRYNAIHRKNDAVCKTCLKREKEELETRRKQQIRDRLPEPVLPVVTVTSATAVQVLVSFPAKNDAIEYSRLSLYYSDDPAMTENVRVKKVAAAAATAVADSESKDKQKMLFISGLTSGKYYYFQVTLGQDDVESERTKPEMVLVDVLPAAPTAIKTSVILTPATAVRIVFNQPASNGGSQIKCYRVYTSTSPSFVEKFLAAEMSTDDLIHDKEDFVAIMYYDPQIAVPLFFKVAAVNVMGEGAASETSAETIVDFPPSKPSKPAIKRISSSAVQVVSHVEPNRGSPVQFFVVMMYQGDSSQGIDAASLQVDSDELRRIEHKETVVPSLHAHPYDLVYTIEGLDRDVLVPAPGELVTEIVSASSVKAIFPSIAHIEQPKIVGFKVMWAVESDMLNLAGSSHTIPVSAADYLIQGLAEGQSYYISFCLVGEHEEGIRSVPVFAPLAAAFNLPPSPPPPPMSDESMGSEYDMTASGHRLFRTASKGSNLSLNQRVVNMHHGMPAYHDPPVDDAHLSPRQSMILNHRRSLDAAAIHSGDDGNPSMRDASGKRVGLGRGGNTATKLSLASKMKTGKSMGNIASSSSGSQLDKSGRGLGLGLGSGLGASSGTRGSISALSQQSISGKHKAAAVAK